MEIYHGSNIAVEEPIAYAGRRNLDFGKGKVSLYTGKRLQLKL